jgi:hypothetical protein
MTSAALSTPDALTPKGGMTRAAGSTCGDK